MTSGAVALLLQQYPKLTPDQVKATLVASGLKLKTSKGELLETGMKSIDVHKAADKARDVLAGKIPSAQNFAPATGLGTLEGARGTDHITDSTGVVLTGEVDVTGAPWDGSTLAARHVERPDLERRRGVGRQPLARLAHRGTGSRWRSDGWSGSRWRSDGWERQPLAGQRLARRRVRPLGSTDLSTDAMTIVEPLHPDATATRRRRSAAGAGARRRDGTRRGPALVGGDRAEG